MDVERNELETEKSKAISGDAPPSYDSLYKRLQSVKEESSGPKDCFQKFMVVLCGSIFGTILIGLVLAVPIAMIAVGATYLNDCPVQRYIPIYLIVGGCFGAVQSILTTCLRVKNQHEGKQDENARPNPGSGIISCFLIAWFIAGSVWVYSIYQTVNTTDPTHLGNYCHPSCYWFAFALLTAGYVFMALSCCCVAMCGCLACCCAKSSD